MFDSALFDSIASPAPSSGSISASTFVVTNIPSSLILGSNYQFSVIFDQNLTTSTSVTLTDGAAVSSVTVSAGSNYGLIGYHPLTTGTKVFGATHSGQSGISNPTISASTNVISVVSVGTGDPQAYLSDRGGKKYDGYTNQFISF